MDESLLKLHNCFMELRSLWKEIHFGGEDLGLNHSENLVFWCLIIYE